MTGQLVGVDLIEVATSKNKEEVLRVEASGLDQRLEMFGPSFVKPKSIWTRFNQMDFGLGGCPKLCSCLSVETEAVILLGRKSYVTILILGSLRVERLEMEMEMLLEIFYRQGWGATLVGSNEDPKLELPRVWELLDKS